MATFIKPSNTGTAEPKPTCDACSLKAGFVLKSGFPAPGRCWYPVYGAPCTLCGKDC